MKKIFLIIGLLLVGVFVFRHVQNARAQGCFDVYGFVYHDQNNNGVKDGGEPGIGGVSMSLRESPGTRIETTTTGTDGGYAFACFSSSNHILRIDSMPVGYTSNQATVRNVTPPVANENFALIRSDLLPTPTPIPPGESGPGGSNPLIVRGVLIAYGINRTSAFNFTRNLQNPASPTETIEYQARMIIELANILGGASFNWQEVAP